MIKYALKSLTADELRFKSNNVRPDTFQINPYFSRQIRQANENPRIHMVVLECKIEGTAEKPTPYNLLARFVGIFEVDDMNTNEDRRLFAMNATETMFPYLRAALSNVLCDALVPPIFLPVVAGGTLFPEDRGPGQIKLNLDPNVVN